MADTLTNRSGTITTGGTPQDVAPTKGTRQYLLIQNPTTNPDSLWVAFGQAAVEDSPSIELPPGATYIFEASFIPINVVSIVGPTTGMSFTVWEG